MSRYAIKKIENEVRIGRWCLESHDVRHDLCHGGCQRAYFLHINDSNFPSPFAFVIQLIMKNMQQLVFGSSNVFS